MEHRFDPGDDHSRYLLLAVLTAIVGGVFSMIGLSIPEVPTPPAQP